MSAYRCVRPLLFALSPEEAHRRSIQAMHLVGRAPWLAGLVRGMCGAEARPVTLFGVTFPNVVGLAAGYDKDGWGWRGLAALGLGHVEVGTVTPRGQAGNPRPRVFRLVEDKGIINRMGFPGDGAEAVRPRLGTDRPFGVVLGVNLGKNKDTPQERAAEDYLTLLRTFADVADYLTINVSSPNTPGLRDLQHKQALGALLAQIRVGRDEQARALGRRIPVLVKLSPDLTEGQLEDALDAILSNQLDGLIATNTTLARDGLRSPGADEQGGLSGAPLAQRSRRLVASARRLVGDKLPIVGVGGIMTPDDARAMRDAGADLLQVYTGLIYHGPALPRRILRGL